MRHSPRFQLIKASGRWSVVSLSSAQACNVVQQRSLACQAAYAWC